MRVAIFGGTGFVGSYLVDALIDGGHQPSALVRPGSEDKLQRPALCHVVSGDIGTETAINATLQSCAAVIYNIGILREVPRDGVTFEELHYNGVVRVVQAARRLEIPRLLLMSANGVRRDGTPYQETKYRAEEYAKSSGLQVTVFRPSVIFGDPHGNMEIATQLCRDMISPPLPAINFFSGLSPTRGKVLMSPVYAGDVAKAFVSSLRDSEANGQTYALAGPEILSWPEMLRRIAAVVDRKKWLLPMPIGLMKLAAGLLDWLPAFPATRDQLSMLAEGNIGDAYTLGKLIDSDPAAFDRTHLAYLRQNNPHLASA